MLKVLLSFLILLFFNTNSIASELPEGVLVAKANTLSICDRLTITASFRDAPDTEKTILVPDVCAVAFQVSSTEIITAAHVLSEAKHKLTGFFLKQAATYERHRGLTFDRKIPIDTMKLSFYHELYSSEGLILRTETVTFVALWNNQDPTRDALAQLVYYLENDAEYKVDSSAASARVIEVDEESDLALLQMNAPLERETGYIEVTDKVYTLWDEVWGINTYPPTMYSDGKPSIFVTSGQIRNSHFTPEIEYWELAERIWTYTVITDHLNTDGNSGGPNVDAEGRLVGITHAVGGAEGIMAVFDIRPPCNVPLAKGIMLTCQRYVIAGHFVHEFLEKVRRKK